MVCDQSQLRRVIKNIQTSKISAICLFCANISFSTTAIAETPDLGSQLEAVSDERLLTSVQSDTYADLYQKLIIKNREIALLRAQISYDLHEKEISSKTLSVNGGGAVRERHSDLVWYKSFANFDINLWTLVSSVLFLWLISRPTLRATQVIEAKQKSDYSSMSGTGISDGGVSFVYYESSGSFSGGNASFLRTEEITYGSGQAAGLIFSYAIYSSVVANVGEVKLWWVVED